MRVLMCTAASVILFAHNSGKNTVSALSLESEEQFTDERATEKLGHGLAQTSSNLEEAQNLTELAQVDAEFFGAVARLAGPMLGGAMRAMGGGMAGGAGPPKANVTIIDASRSLYGGSGGLASQMKTSMQN